MTPHESPRAADAGTWAARYERGMSAEARRECWADLDTGWAMALELLSGILVWGGVGFLLDRWLATSPWLFSVGCVVGNGAGLYLLFLRSSGRLSPPSVRGGRGAAADDTAKAA